MALWPIFCVARSSRTDLSMLVARALKIGKIADGGMPPPYRGVLRLKRWDASCSHLPGINHPELSSNCNCSPSTSCLATI